MKFPNKTVKATYDSAIDKTFTWSPHRQVFTDEDGNTSYDYHAMCWLKDNNVLILLPYDVKNFVNQYRIKNVMRNR